MFKLKGSTDEEIPFKIQRRRDYSEGNACRKSQADATYCKILSS